MEVGKSEPRSLVKVATIFGAKKEWTKNLEAGSRKIQPEAGLDDP